MKTIGNERCLSINIGLQRLLIFLCAAATLFHVSADDTFSVGGLTYYKNSPSTVSVVPGKVDFRGRSSYNGDVTVPAYVRHNGRKYKVTTIGEGAFNCKRLSSLVISEGVTEIEKYAIVIEDLGSLTIPGSIKNVPYCYVGNMSELNIGEGVETLSEMDMTGPAEIIIPASVRLISSSFGGRMTYDKSKQQSIPRQKITFRGKPEKISYSFTGIGIGEVDVAADTISNSFLDCPFLSKASVETGNVVIDRSFSRCDNLSEISLPESLKQINESFSNLPRLESIAIPNSVTQITKSFRDTDNILYLSLGTGWTSLSDSPHIICRRVKGILMPWATPPDFWSNVWRGIQSVTIYIPDEYLDRYEEARKKLMSYDRYNVFDFKVAGDNFIFPPK